MNLPKQCQWFESPPVNLSGGLTSFTAIRASMRRSSRNTVRSKQSRPETNSLEADAIAHKILATGHRGWDTDFAPFDAPFQRRANRAYHSSRVAVALSIRRPSRIAPDAYRHSEAGAHHRVRNIQHHCVSWGTGRAPWLETQLGCPHAVNCCHVCGTGRVAPVVRATPRTTVERCLNRFDRRATGAGLGLGLCKTTSRHS